MGLLQQDRFSSAATTNELLAHISAHMCLFTKLFWSNFFIEMPHLKDVCLKPAKEVPYVCTNMAFGGSNTSELIRNANRNLLEVLDENVIEHLRIWEKKKSSSAMFKSLMN